MNKQQDPVRSLDAGNLRATQAADTRPVRASEELDWTAIAEYCRPALAETCADRRVLSAPMQVEQFPGGHSNLTYLLRFDSSEFVLRRPPFGPVPPRAHDMAREYKILSSIHPVFPLAPRPLLLCDDAGIAGSVFYIMERRRGLVVRDEEPMPLALPAIRSRVSESMVDTLADLHHIGSAALRLDSFGKPHGFVERQVRGWTERWIASKTSQLREMDWISKWLAERLPAAPSVFSLVHGDFKLDNVMLSSVDPGRIVAVLDWEMSAVGDPLIDLGILLCYWIHIAAAGEGAVGCLTTRPGWYTRGQVLQRYAERTGAGLQNIRFYEVFAVFKLAVVIQQIFYRFRRGQTDDPRFAGLDKNVAALARIAVGLMSK